jgi:hypothetical protein
MACYPTEHPLALGHLRDVLPRLRIKFFSRKTYRLNRTSVLIETPNGAWTRICTLTCYSYTAFRTQMRDAYTLQDKYVSKKIHPERVNQSQSFIWKHCTWIMDIEKLKIASNKLKCHVQCRKGVTSFCPS